LSDQPDSTEPGVALVPYRGGTMRVVSCEECADTLGHPWIPTLEKGNCEGCGVPLIP
jgi:hypothetical protein